MPQTLSFPLPITTVVTMTGRPVAAANRQRIPLYLRTRGVIGCGERSGVARAARGQYHEQRTFRHATFLLA